MGKNLENALKEWGERYLFLQETPFQKGISLFLRPLSWVYCGVMALRRNLAIPQKFPIPIVSVGNLTVGGNGKTPFCIALSNHFQGGCVVMRGYGRSSRGLVVVAHNQEICTDVHTSGDEAMEIALSSPLTTVVVCEKREEGIAKAVELGSRYVILDDGFSKVHIEKFEILLEPSSSLPPYCLPSGAYRESPKTAKVANLVLKEGDDFTRDVVLENGTQRMVLTTAIAKAWRLDPFLTKEVCGRVVKPDHTFFTKEELEEIMKTYDATSLLVTMKDLVKIAPLGLPLSVLRLKLVVKGDVFERVERYLREFHKDSGKIAEE